MLDALVSQPANPETECAQHMDIISTLSNSIMVYPVDSSSYQQIAQSSNGVSIDMDLLQVGSEPVGVRCPYCQEDVMTRAVYRNTTITHTVAFILGLFFWWVCCCLIPYVSKRWKDVHHSCPSCKNNLGVYTRKSII